MKEQQEEGARAAARVAGSSGGPFDQRLRETEQRLRELADALKAYQEGGDSAGLEAAVGLEGEAVNLSIVRHVRLRRQGECYVALAAMTRPTRLTWRAWAIAVADQVARRQRSSRPPTDSASDLAQRILNNGPALSADVLRQTVLPQAFDRPNKYWKTRR
jgi:hypothetical protein